MKLLKKPKSKFYWYDFTVRGRRYRASTRVCCSSKENKKMLAYVALPLLTGRWALTRNSQHHLGDC